MKRVAIMCRVSSDEQAKGYSLDAQFESLTRFCERMDYEIVYVIREDHSAKTFDRPEWKKWLGYAQKEYRNIDQLLVTSWDRFTRNAEEGNMVITNHINKWNIEIQAIEQPIDYNVPEQRKLILSIYLNLPEVDNMRRSIKIKGGIRQALKQGRWPAKAIFGYKTERDPYGKSGLVPCPVTAPIVKYIYEQMALGVPQIELCKAIKEDYNVRISRSAMWRIVKRSLYISKLVVPADGKEPAQIVQGIHEPLVSEDLFYKVQSLLSTNRKARNKFIPKYTKMRDEFPLRGILNCNSCGHTMTASSSKGKSGKKFGYYHCNHCKQQRASSKQTHEAFGKLLDGVTIEPNTVLLYNEVFDDMQNGSADQNKTEAKNLQKQLDQINERLIKSQDLMLDGKLDPDEYVAIKARVQEQRTDLTEKITALKADKKDFGLFAKSSLNLLANLREAFENASIRLKHKIACSIFPNLFSFDGKKCRTPKLNPVFELFATIDEGFREIKKGTSDLNYRLSLSAERQGFEPWHRFPGDSLANCSFNHSGTSPNFK